MTGFYITGSINVPTVDDAFRLVGSRLQPAVTRVSDGEPGNRANWVLTQADHFLKNPTLDVVDGRARVRAGTAVSFGPVDYHTVAADSYQRFLAARQDGVLAEESRFLVSIATPFNAVNSFAKFDSQIEIAYAYERWLRESVDALQDAIPPNDLAIQWDLPTELATIEGWFPNPYGGVEPIYAATARLADWVHDDAESGRAALRSVSGSRPTPDRYPRVGRRPPRRPAMPRRRRPAADPSLRSRCVHRRC
jgi:hypothetical protein